jgi:ribosomal protein L32
MHIEITTSDVTAKPLTPAKVKINIMENENTETKLESSTSSGKTPCSAKGRIPSYERGCKGKINLGRSYKKQADRLSSKHEKIYGVYQCPHCEGYHLTTKMDKVCQYAPILYISEPNTEPASGRVRRLVVRKFILSLCVLWMIPWYLVTQVLRAILCVTVGAQNLWWHPIREAKDSWDSNA